MYSVSLAEVLFSQAESEEQKRQVQRQYYNRLLSLLHILDLLSCLILIGASESKLEEIFEKEGYSFKHGTAVCLILAISRIILFPLLANLGGYFGRETTHLKENKHKAKQDKEEELKERLLAHEAEINDGAFEKITEINDKAEDFHERKEKVKLSLKAREKAQTYKYLFLGLVFFFSSAYQIFVGIKVSSYEWRHEKTLEIFSMCVSVLWINLMAYYYRAKISDDTKEEGLYIPKVHKHPVFWGTGYFRHRCDLCGKSIRNKVGGVFRCKLCDWDCCVACCKRDDIQDVGENLLRSDKGVRQEKNVSNYSYFKRALELARPQWNLISVSLTVLALNCGCNLALPHMQGRIINNLIERNVNDFYGNVEKYVFIMLVQGLFTGLSNYLFRVVARTLGITVRNKLFSHILAQDVAFFDGTTSGYLVSKLSYEVNGMVDPIRTSLGQLLSNIILLIGGIFMCYYSSYKLSLLAFVSVGPIMFLWDQYGEFSKKVNRKMLVAYAQANSVATEALNHIREVKSFSTEEKECSLFNENTNLALKAGLKDAFFSGLTEMGTGYLDLGTGVLILWFGGLLVLSKSISVGELIAFQFYWNMMNSSYQSLQGILVNFTRSSAAAEKVFTLMDNIPDIDLTKGQPVDWEVKGHLELRSVSFFYQMRPYNKVLTDVNLNILPGTVCALVGRSGGGKSSIVKLLLRFYDPKSGGIYLDGRNFQDLKVGELRKNFGCVAQNSTLFAKTILYNITYGLDEDEYTLEDVYEACKKAQCYDFIMGFKDKFQTRVGEAGTRISGGQCQRIAIARIFLRKPKVVLLDEATSALDEESQARVQSALDDLMAEKQNDGEKHTIVLVAHRLSTVQFADKIAVVDKGVILEEGNHTELLRIENGIYRRLVTLKKERERSLLEGNGEKKEVEGLEKLMEEVMKEKANENAKK
eukprot:maker-scaffold_15-snap-gene-4.0-mRNA-1 protein AED:0.08 eAED:0.08 QI:0/1/0.5/1/1/1/2/25/926